MSDWKTFLAGTGLPEAAQSSVLETLTANEMTFDLLPDLSEQLLVDRLKLPLGHALKILKHRTALETKPASDALLSVPAGKSFVSTSGSEAQTSVSGDESVEVSRDTSFSTQAPNPATPNVPVPESGELRIMDPDELARELLTLSSSRRLKLVINTINDDIADRGARILHEETYSVKVLRALWNQSLGLDYLRVAVKPAIKLVLKTTKKHPDLAKPELSEKNQPRLLKLAKEVLEGVFSSSDSFPEGMAGILRKFYLALRPDVSKADVGAAGSSHSSLSESEEPSDHSSGTKSMNSDSTPSRVPMVIRSMSASARGSINWLAQFGAFFFLRFICPAIASPQTYGLVKTKDVTPAARAVFGRIIKIVQAICQAHDDDENLARPSSLGELEFAKDFVQDQVLLVSAFTQAILYGKGGFKHIKSNGTGVDLLCAQVAAQAEEDFMLPLVMKVAHRPQPEMFAGFWIAFKESMLATGGISRPFKEMIATVVSSSTNCSFCFGGHCMLLKATKSTSVKPFLLALERGNFDEIEDPRLANILKWSSSAMDPVEFDEATQGPKVAERPPVSDADLPEVAAVVFTILYMNRMTSLVCPPSMLPSGMGWMSKIMPMFMGKFVNQQIEPGQSLFLLPGEGSELPADMQRYLAGNHVLSAAFAKMAAAFSRAAEHSIAPSALAVFEKYLRKWSVCKYLKAKMPEKRENDDIISDDGFWIPTTRSLSKKVASYERLHPESSARSIISSRSGLDSIPEDDGASKGNSVPSSPAMGRSRRQRTRSLPPKQPGDSGPSPVSESPLADRKVSRSHRLAGELARIMLVVALCPNEITSAHRAEHIAKFGEKVTMTAYCWASWAVTRVILAQIPIAEVEKDDIDSDCASEVDESAAFGVDPSMLEHEQDSLLDGTKVFVPSVLIRLKEVLIKDGITTEGIFRIPGNGTRLVEIQQLLSASTFHSNGVCDVATGQVPDLHEAANLITKWYGGLPQRLFDGFSSQQLENAARDPALARGLMENLDRSKRPLLSWLIDLCQRVIKHERLNKMKGSSLAIVIGPNLLTDLRCLPSTILVVQHLIAAKDS